MSRVRRHPVLSTIAAVAVIALAIGLGGWVKHRDANPDGPSALVAFDAHTGAVRWSRPMASFTGPAQLDDVVALASANGHVAAVDVGDGRTVWDRSFGTGPGSRLAEPAVVVANGAFVTITPSGQVVALDPSSGSTKWTADIGNPSGVVALVGGDVVYVMGEKVTEPVPSNAAPVMPAGGPGVLAAIDAKTGQVLHDGSPPVDELIHDSTYADGRQQISVGTRDPATGTERWRAVVPGYHADLIGDQVIVADQTGGIGDATALTADHPTVHDTLTAYAASDGRQLWRVDLPSLTNGVFGAAGALATPTGRSAVTTLDPKTGAIVWTSDGGSPGMSDRDSEPGRYRWISGNDATVIGLIVAEQPED